MKNGFIYVKKGICRGGRELEDPVFYLWLNE